MVHKWVEKEYQQVRRGKPELVLRDGQVVGRTGVKEEGLELLRRVRPRTPTSRVGGTALGTASVPTASNSEQAESAPPTESKEETKDEEMEMEGIDAALELATNSLFSTQQTSYGPYIPGDSDCAIATVAPQSRKTRRSHAPSDQTNEVEQLIGQATQNRTKNISYQKKTTSYCQLLRTRPVYGARPATTYQPVDKRYIGQRPRKLERPQSQRSLRLTKDDPSNLRLEGKQVLH